MEAVEQNRELQVVVTAGVEEPSKAILALECAAVATLAGVETVVFFTQRGTQWTCRSELREGHAPRVLELLEQCLAGGARLEACAACIEKHCAVDGPTSVGGFLREDVQASGLAVLVARTVRGVSTLTF